MDTTAQAFTTQKSTAQMFTSAQTGTGQVFSAPMGTTRSFKRKGYEMTVAQTYTLAIRGRISPEAAELAIRATMLHAYHCGDYAGGRLAMGYREALERNAAKTAGYVELQGRAATARELRTATIGGIR